MTFSLSLYSYESEFVGNLLKNFSATLIAHQLLFKPKVKTLLKEKYSSFKNENDDYVE